jgi:hypothetical protein
MNEWMIERTNEYEKINKYESAFMVQYCRILFLFLIDIPS